MRIVGWDRRIDLTGGVQIKSVTRSQFVGGGRVAVVRWPDGKTQEAPVRASDAGGWRDVVATVLRTEWSLPLGDSARGELAAWLDEREAAHPTTYVNEGLALEAQHRSYYGRGD